MQSPKSSDLIAEASAFLSSLVNFEKSTLPSSRQLSLEPSRTLLGLLGNPHDQLKIIHIAGTKGKGSVANMLQRVLQQAGYTTGLYTSPHMVDFTDRFRINGCPISKEALSEIVLRIRAQANEVERLCHKWPSHFDVSTALAYLYFHTQRVDVAIIEVGMGGRVDSTNVCTPIVSVITNIGFDHTNQLGHTLEAIASEKAGIIKPGRPTVTAIKAPEALRVVEQRCDECNSPLTKLGTDFTFQCATIGQNETIGDLACSIPQTRVRVTTQRQAWPPITLAMLGEHQANNAAVCIATVEVLQELGYTISTDHVIDALSNVQCPARVEIIRTQPLVILDCAHNTSSAFALAQSLRTIQDTNSPRTKSRRKGRWTLVYASSRDKDIAGVLAQLTPLFDKIILTSYGDSRRSASEDDLRVAIASTSCQLPVEYIPSAEAALQSALANASADDAVCVTGSVFLAGELSESLNQLKPSPIDQA